MPRLFFSNFDFEHGLSKGAAANLPALLRQLNSTMSGVWTAVADDGDFAWLATDIETGFFEQLAEAGLPKLIPVRDEKDVADNVELVPWGTAPEFTQMAIEQNWRYEAPDAELVQKVNRRSFRLSLEMALGCNLQNSSVVTSIEQLQTALASLTRSWPQWVLKAEFGMSSRERMRGSGEHVDDDVMRWATKRLAANGCLVVEPWVEAIEEVGLQFTIPYNGAPLLEGITPMMQNKSGHYGGNHFSIDVDLELRWMPAVEIGYQVASLLKHEGFFGPLGIDAMRYIDAAGNEKIRSLQDLNARHTMGRMALGFRRLLNRGDFGSLLHIPWSNIKGNSLADWYNDKVSLLPQDVRAIRLTPFEVAGQASPVGMVVLLGPTAELLTQAESVFLQSPS